MVIRYRSRSALRDVGRQMVRNRGAFGKKPEDVPVFGTSAATFNDDGVTALYQELRGLLVAKALMQEGGVIACGLPRAPLAPLHPQTRDSVLRIARRLDPMVLRWGR